MEKLKNEVKRANERMKLNEWRNEVKRIDLDQSLFSYCYWMEVKNIKFK